MARWGPVLTVLILATACGGTAGPAGSTVQVIAGENFWGSVAAQLGGSKVTVQSVVTDPNADPHEYESSAADARAFAEARLVILNGAGYDGWGQKLLDANPSAGRRVVTVAGVLHRRTGDNPHFWYDPAAVTQVADRITAEYKALDPADATYFDDLRTSLTAAFQPYLGAIAAIRRAYANASIGSTESVFVYMAQALGLRLTTPTAFMDAVAQGNDPPAGAVVAFQGQIAAGTVRVLVYNLQTATAVTTNIKALAASHHVPSVGVSETMEPPGGTFQDWQLLQLDRLASALRSTG